MKTASIVYTLNMIYLIQVCTGTTIDCFMLNQGLLLTWLIINLYKHTLLWNLKRQTREGRNDLREAQN